MFKVLLNVQLLFAVIVADLVERAPGTGIAAIRSNRANKLSTGEVGTTNAHCEYPKDAFQLLIRNQCPAAHSSCVIDVPFDLPVKLKYRCATAPRRKTLTVNPLNTSQLLMQVSNDSESYGSHSRCMLTAFYAPGCAFSARMVPYLYQLPRMYPRLHVVITDASHHSKLNSRYGIIGTPTVLIWVDGTAVSRMDEAPFSLEAFKNYIEKWTDLEAEFIPAAEKKIISAEEIGLFEVKEYSDTSFDWHFWASWCSFVPSVIYFLIRSKYGQTLWKIIHLRYGANEAQR